MKDKISSKTKAANDDDKIYSWPLENLTTLIEGGR